MSFAQGSTGTGNEAVISTYISVVATFVSIVAVAVSSIPAPAAIAATFFSVATAAIATVLLLLFLSSVMLLLLLIIKKLLFAPLSRDERGGLSRKEILESVKESLQNLQLEYIDLVIINKYDPNCPMEGDKFWGKKSNSFP